MANQPKSKSMVGWGLAAVLVVALVLVLGVPGRSDELAPQEATSTGTRQASGSPEGPGALSATEEGSLQSEEPPQQQEAMPIPPCWGDLPELDQALTLDNFRTALSSAVASEDRFLMTYLQERLMRMVGNDPQKALKVLSWAEEVGEGTELIVYMEALKQTPAIQNPKVSNRLLQLAENAQGPMPLRAAAVIGLETQKSLDAASLQRLKAIALDTTVDQVAWNATRTIGRVLEEDFKSTGNYKSYWENLLEISRKSEDRAVRGLALEMPAYAQLIVDEKAVDALSEIMRTDRDYEVREFAAMHLSSTENPQKALEAYREAFKTENDFCVRWAFFRFALKAAGAAALPLVEQFAQQEPRLQQDYLDFKAIYAQGMQDWDQVFIAKEPSHADCQDRHEEGQ